MRHALALPLLVGCHSLIGIDDFSTAGDDGDDGATPTGITGTAIDTYFTELGEEAVPEDLSKAAISVYLADGTVLPGSGDAAGHFAVPDVPPGDYYLRIAAPDEPVQIYRLTARELDLGRALAGKAHPPGALQLPSPVTLTATGMQPFFETDELAVYASAIGAEQTPTLTAGVPGFGVERVSGATFDWSGQPPLQGDGLWMIHRRGTFEQVASLTTSFAADAAYVPGLTQIDGQPLAVAGVFSPGARRGATLIVDVDDIRRSNPGDQSRETIFAQLIAAPDRGAGTLGGPRVLDVAYIPKRPVPAVTHHQVEYQDPFPAGWTRYSEVRYSRRRRGVQLAQQNTTLLLGQSLVARSTGVELPSLNAASARFPTTISIDGTPLIDSVHLHDGKPVTVTWDPVPGATYYTVSVFAVALASNGDHIEVPVILASATNEVIVPGDLLADQQRFVFHVEAMLGGSLEPAPNRIGPAPVTSTATSDVMLVSSTCGDGDVDAGETCDTAGPSATCDLDCTAPACGDGIANLAAGEECDLTTAAAGDCVACKRVVCGDGVRAGLEECDDHNTANGDGCSATCRFEPSKTCGNGAVEPGEQCDDGNTSDFDACRNNCTRSVCGDFTQTGAEECDDGNNTSGDGCSSQCKLERCGDGIVKFPEECDDGNTTSGDGCSSTCKVTP